MPSQFTEGYRSTEQLMSLTHSAESFEGNVTEAAAGIVTIRHQEECVFLLLAYRWMVCLSHAKKYRLGVGEVGTTTMHAALIGG